MLSPLFLVRDHAKSGLETLHASILASRRRAKDRFSINYFNVNFYSYALMEFEGTRLRESSTSQFSHKMKSCHGAYTILGSRLPHISNFLKSKE